GDGTVLKLLIAAGADVNKPDALGRTPLHLASLAGNAVATRVLVQAGADVCRTDVRRGATPAHYAAAFARVESIQLLLSA
ncbi:ankyrin repeat protein, partial [Pelagophyceae sp. CCMP2097]